MFYSNIRSTQRIFLVTLLLICSPLFAAQFIVQTNLDLPADSQVNQISPGVFAVQTLRSAIALANDENAHPGGDVITFDFDSMAMEDIKPSQGSSNTIEIGLIGDQFNFLNQSSPSAFGINSTITIDGELSGAQQVELSALGLRHFQVNTGGRLRLQNLSVSDGETPLNSAGRGGAVVVQNSAQLEVDDCDFSFNQAVNGGAIAIQSGALASEIKNTLFLFNAASDEIAQTENGAGGALFAANSVFPLMLENNRFNFNNADANGGAVYLSGVATFDRNELFNNDADLSGGGLYMDVGSGATITNSLIYDNVANAFGGGVAMADSALAQIINTTITENRAGALTTPSRLGAGSEQGGGVYVAVNGDLLLHNSIVSDNDNSGQQVDVTGAVDAQSSHNLIGVDQSLQNISDGNNGNLIGTVAQPIDPLIEFDFLLRIAGLMPNSPALDVGNDAVVNMQNLTTDYRGNGFPRISGPASDIGAFEMDYIFVNGFE